MEDNNKKIEKNNNLTTQITRREMIGGIGSLAVAPSLLATDTQDVIINPSNAPINFSDPIQNVAAYVKLIGSTEKGMVHTYIKGTIFGITPDQGVKPMIGYNILIKTVWKPWTDNSFFRTLYSYGYFIDLKTGLPAEEFENPFTGEINRPVKIIGGPFDDVFKPEVRKFNVRNNDVWLNEDVYINVVNKLDPEIWRKASAGKTLNFLYVESYNGKLSNLANPKIYSAPMKLISTHNTSWYPFFLMGQRPGGHYWQAIGKKVENLESDVPIELINYVEKEQPGYFESEKPWKKRKDIFQTYKDEREPIQG